MRIVLASKSPRRREILSNIGLEFEIVESDFEEIIDDTKDPVEVVKHLAYEKAKDVSDRLNGTALVIGADTVVVCGTAIMGKPQNEQQAFDMLKTLSGNLHSVYTGICVIDSASKRYLLDYERTYVKIKVLSDTDILEYINTKEPFDKAGSYAIQGIGSLIVEKIDGCYFNVVGLPIFRLSNVFKEFGVNLMNLRG